ncbi:unnamed protein product [Absidia cylindrospora]
MVTSNTKSVRFRTFLRQSTTLTCIKEEQALTTRANKVRTYAYTYSALWPLIQMTTHVMHGLICDVKVGDYQLSC